MLSDTMLFDLQVVLQTQHHLLQQMQATTATIAEEVTAQQADIQELQRLLDEIEVSADLLTVDDPVDFDLQAIPRLYAARQSAVAHDLHQIAFTNWPDFVRQCQKQALLAGLDPLAPYETLLTCADMQRLRDEYAGTSLPWDRWDYLLVGASGVLAALTDYLLVGIPTTLVTGAYAGQIGSPLTTWLKQYDTHTAGDWVARWARVLEEQCRVPYDSATVLKGMSGRSHRLQSLGHDPVLGFVFGVLDIMRGTLTGFSYEHLCGVHRLEQLPAAPGYVPENFIEALLRHIGHLISDVGTPMGLPSPFMTLVQGINAGQFGSQGHTAGQVARWMYLNGYDLRHFLVTGLTPATIEIILRAYLMLRHYAEHGETRVNLTTHPKYRTMLLTAHAIATLGNVGKIVLFQGNPLAINYAEWMALFRYLLPSIKHWIFDRQRFQVAHLERLNEEGWNSLLHNSRYLLGLVVTADTPMITLGKRVI